MDGTTPRIFREAALRRGLLSSGATLWLVPSGILHGESAVRLMQAGPGHAPAACPLAGGTGAGAGGAAAFTALEVIARHDGNIHLFGPAPVAEVAAWAGDEGLQAPFEARMQALTAARQPLCGLPSGRPLVMGIVNVTPDSFSDGGDFMECGRAVAHARRLLAEGADILDIGGESTRPGAVPVPVEEELRRVVPVIEGIRRDIETGRGAGRPFISIDTRRPAVMRAALAAGADIINDVTGLADPESRHIAAEAGVPVMLMHMRGAPQSMQNEAVYDFAPLQVAEELEERIIAAVQAGIARERITLDPGIGFAKTAIHNLEVIARLGLLHGLGCPLLLGVSRKRFIGALNREEPAGQRLPGSLAAALAGLEQGVRLLRVHDVAETVQALKIWSEIAARR